MLAAIEGRVKAVSRRRPIKKQAGSKGLAGRNQILIGNPLSKRTNPIDQITGGNFLLNVPPRVDRARLPKLLEPRLLLPTVRTCGVESVTEQGSMRQSIFICGHKSLEIVLFLNIYGGVEFIHLLYAVPIIIPPGMSSFTC